MPTTTPETIKELLAQGFDRQYHEFLYKLERMAFGEGIEDTVQPVGPDEFPDFPDVSPTKLQIGRSRRILSAQFINLTKIMGGEPEPEFPHIDKFTGEARKQFIKQRARGLHGKGEWGPQRALAFGDGDGLGVGFLQVGLRTNPETGLQYVTTRHVPATNVIWDKHVNSPTLARWICFVHNMAPQEAAKLYGKAVVDEFKRQVNDRVDGQGANYDVVRIFEWYDTGIGDSEPTYCLIGGTLQGRVIKRGPNPFGQCLPFAHYEHFIPSGCRRPVGRILQQIAGQAMINKIERRWDKTLERIGFDVADMTALDPKDVEALQRGDAKTIVKLLADKPNAFQRIPAGEIAASDIQLLELWLRQFTEDSGATDMDRGIQSSEQRTLGENQMLDERSSVRASWSRLQAAKMELRLMEKVCYIAKLYDRDPIQVDIFGSNVLINDPARPESWVDQFMEEPSEILIDEASLEYQDQQTKQMNRLAQLNQIKDEVGMGIIDPIWYAKEKLRAIGEKDPDSALLMPEQSGGMMGAPMAPVMDPMAMQPPV